MFCRAIRFLVVGLVALAGPAVRAAETAAAPPEGKAAQAPAPSAEAAAAKQAFDTLVIQFRAAVGEMNKVRRQRDDAEGDEKLRINADLLKMRADVDKVTDKLVDAGVAAYKLAPEAYPEVNSTLLVMGQFYLIGDPNTGDSGDQYEKALPLVKALLDAGAGAKWPQLWAWGGLAAYSVNDFPLAEQYFAKAKEVGSGMDGMSPRLAELVDQAQKNLPQLKQNWVKEKELRDAEAKADDLPRVKLTTTRGEIVIELFENEAPEAVANFISLVKKGFYSNVVFHRVLPGFMAQGGDPTGTGSGGPGYCIRCECYTPNYRRHFRGSLSMAHAGRDTGGSQFFLTFVPTSFLDGRHTVFGRVVEGMDVASSLRRRDPDAGGPSDMIIKAEVQRDRGHEYTFTKLPGR